MDQSMTDAALSYECDLTRQATEDKFLALQAIASIKAEAETSKKALEGQYAEWTRQFKEQMSTRVYIDLAGSAAAMAAYQKIITTCELYERIYGGKP